MRKFSIVILLGISLLAQGCLMAMAGFNAGIQTPMPFRVNNQFIKIKDRIKEKQEATDPVWKPDNMTEVVDPYWKKQ
jgi:hypothetical protein